MTADQISLIVGAAIAVGGFVVGFAVGALLTVLARWSE